MIITLKPNSAKKETSDIIRKIKSLGFMPHVSRGASRTIIGVIGKNAILTRDKFEGLPQIESLTPISKPYKLVSREFRKENSVVRFGENRGRKPVLIGGRNIAVIAGPCSVESREKIIEAAKAVKSSGAAGLRGGAYKPRTNPYSFQGLGEEGLKYLAEASRVTGLPFVTEIMNPQLVHTVSRYADMLQVGARNMQNYDLLKEIGRTRKPVLLKRGLSATVEELLMSAEYIMSQGNYNVVLCERGIRTFEQSTRFTLDLNAVPVIKKFTHLPVIVDPSHGVGIREYVPAMAKAAVSAGADGLIIEVHQSPETAFSDGPQSLLPGQFARLIKELKPVARAVGRTLK